MANSVFEIFKIGIGPSSSHTAGPMVAGALYAHLFDEKGVLNKVGRVSCEFFGSLALAGIALKSRRVSISLFGNTEAKIINTKAKTIVQA